MLLLVLALGCGPGKAVDDTAGGGGDGGADGGGDGDGGTDGGSDGDGGADGGEVDGGGDGGGEPLGVGPRCALPAAPPAPAGRVAIERVYGEVPLSMPIHAELGPDGAWWVAQQRQGIVRFEDDLAAAEVEVALDLSARIQVGYESGVIGLALAPDFVDSGRAYVVYTTPGGGGGVALRWFLSRFTSPDGRTLDPDSEQVILALDQPYTNHNGGALRFGPDGYLYVAVGDGGSGGDPLGHGQDPYTLFGTILRLDVSGDGPGYAVPADNPTADGLLGAPEVWAWGLRNPWSFHFDAATGELWAGDVGQDAWEEVDRIEAGGNYGWNELEGAHCYVADCDPAGTILPVAEYDHSLGESITGGVVYRGTGLDLYGAYLYADFVTGRLWSLQQDPGSGDWVSTEQLDADHYWSGFAVDADGEVLLLSLYGGSIWKLVPAGEAEEVAFPGLLSETGCVVPEDPTTASAGLIPYTVAHPFWSDGAEKGRWLSLPEGVSATVGASGDLELPPGSAVVKDFSLDGRRFETRLLVHHEDGSWRGYTYRWREDGGDAELLPGSLREEIGGQTWHYPSGGECLQCHTEVAGRSLGLELRQLGEQAAAWAEAGLLAGETAAEPLAARDDPDREAAARSYLHVNCAMCHQPGGPVPGALDLRVDTPLASTGLCAPPTEGTLGIDDARVVAPGEPERSVLLARVRDLGAARMPPLGSLVVDEEGAALLEAWIAGLGACE